MHSNTSEGSGRGDSDGNAWNSLRRRSCSTGGSGSAAGGQSSASEVGDHGTMRPPMDDSSMHTYDDTEEAYDEGDDEDGSAMSNNSAMSAPQTEEEWNENFELLQNFYTENSHCNVPFTKAWTNLAVWLYKQNRQQNLLEVDQVERLTALGALKQRKRQVIHVCWDQRYAELVEFKKSTLHWTILPY